MSPTSIRWGGAVTIDVHGPALVGFRLGVGAPSGDWAFGEFATDASGDAQVSFSPWRDAGPWLASVDLGGGPSSFDAAHGRFDQN